MAELVPFNSPGIVVILLPVLLLSIARADLPGTWEVIVQDAGIASMHTAVTRFNTVVLLDRTNIGSSRKALGQHRCRKDPNDAVLKRDCYAHSVIESIIKCDVDIRRELYSGILLTGGTSSMQQLKERFEKGLVEESPQSARVKVLAGGNTVERRFSVWIGGSILASLGSFQQMWFSKSEYEEQGSFFYPEEMPLKLLEIKTKINLRITLCSTCIIFVVFLLWPR